MHFVVPANLSVVFLTRKGADAASESGSLRMNARVQREDP